MNDPRRRIQLALSALAVTAVAACAPTAGPPVSDFTANGDTPVGMPGMTAMAPRPQAPAPAPQTAPAPVAGTAVEITNFAFAPASLTVKTGGTVTWVNHDEEPHTVVADNGSFHSPGIGSDGTYSFTFTAPGSYAYTCGIHPFMHGTVVVTP